MDPALWELINDSEGHSDDEIEAIIRLDRPDIDLRGVRIISRFGPIATCRLKRNAIRRVHAEDEVQSLKAPRLLGPEPVTEGRGHRRLVRDKRAGLEASATGAGVIVGVLDWGCDFDHPDFKSPDGSTRLLAFWDQRGRPPRGQRNKYGYGTIYSRNRIQRALRSRNPYGHLGYHPAVSDSRGSGSHGTHVMGIAAGNGRSGGPKGMAPEADLVFVHLGSTRVKALSNLGDSVGILEAVDFVSRIAGRRPWVINMSVGRHGGPHDGTTLAEMAFDALLRESPGRFIVQSAGNYYKKNVHTAGVIKAGEEKRMRWIVRRSDRTPNELELWYHGSDVYAVGLISPDGKVFPMVELGGQADIRENGQLVGRIYNRSKDPNNFDNHIDLFLYTNATPGAWTILLKANSVVNGTYHAWVERDDRGQSRLGRKRGDRTFTLGTLANSNLPLVVGAYDPHEPGRPISSFSSSGPTRDHREKPDLLAPGTRILAPRSAQRSRRRSSGLHAYKSGTSMAAPHVTGTVALCMQAAGRRLWSHEIRSIVLGSTDPVALLSPRSGRGYLNAPRAVAAARRSRPLEVYAEGDGRASDVLPQVSAASDNEDTLWTETTYTPFNTYIYVVGTDRSGKGDFNEMRKLLQLDTKYKSPWLAITFDYKKGENNAALGELRWTSRKGSSRPKSGSRRIGTDFARIFKTIQRLGARGSKVRELHFLSHFGSDRVYYTPHSPGRQGFRFSDVKKAIKKKKDFVAAFEKDSLIKIHGCQVDKKVVSAIKSYCSGTRQLANLKFIRSRIEASFPFRLAAYLGHEVWATPMGAYAIYECTYLSNRQKKRTFCIENDKNARHTFQRTLRFYEANFGQLFDQATGEVIFDQTLHMKYKPALRSATSLLPQACSTAVPQPATPGSLSVAEQLWDFERVSEFIEQFEPHALFRKLVYDHDSSDTENLQRHFQVLARPGDPLEFSPSPGDVLVNVALGEPGIGKISVISENEIQDTGEFLQSGETEVFSDNTLEPNKKLPPGSLLLRVNDPEGASATLGNPEWSFWHPPRPLQTQCGFASQRGVATEAQLRNAVATVTQAQRAHWLNARGRIVSERANSRFGRLVGYWLSRHASIRPTTLAAIQQRAVDPAINYGRLLNNLVPGPVLRAELRRVTRDLLRGVPDATRPANLARLVEGALTSTRFTRRGDLNRGPWSAVFVIACIREAATQLGIEAYAGGVYTGQDALLRATSAHRIYTLEAYNRRFGPHARQGTYHAFAPNDRVPQPGDIIVQDRRSRITMRSVLPFRRIPVRLARGFITHGDIVLQIAADRSHVITIGGNVGDSVRRRRFPLDANGRLVVAANQLYTQEDNRGRLPAIPRPRLRRGNLHTRSTGRIFALLSPVMACYAPPGQHVRGGIFV